MQTPGQRHNVDSSRAVRCSADAELYLSAPFGSTWRLTFGARSMEGNKSAISLRNIGVSALMICVGVAREKREKNVL